MSVNKHITIRQVAQQAGVSIQTVSRVLNQRPDVSPETRQRVQQIIDELNFKPYAAARGLASRRTHTLGLVCNWFGDPFLDRIITGAETVCHQNGYFLMLGNSNWQPNELPSYFRLVTERHVEGVLFAGVGNEQDERFLADIHSKGIPVVITGYHKTQATDFSYVDTANVEGGQQATGCLVELGHTQIAMITGPSNYKSANDRAQGYMEILSQKGIPLNPGLIIESCSWEYAEGYLATQQLLERGIPFTAVFAHNDRIALAAIYALRQAGYRIPEDISIVGFDNLPMTEFTDPPLTTIKQKTLEIGEAGARLLIKQIEEPESMPELILFHTELIERASCRCR